MVTTESGRYIIRPDLAVENAHHKRIVLVMYNTDEVFPDLEELASDIRTSYPQAIVSLDYLGRIGAMLNIVLSGELIVVEFACNDGFGVTQVTDDMDFMRVWDEKFVDLAEVKRYLDELLVRLSQRTTS